MIKAFFVLVAFAVCVSGAGIAYTRTLPVDLTGSSLSARNPGSALGQDGVLERCHRRHC